MTELNLKDIQGLILSGYGHLDHGCYLLLQCSEAQSGRAWLRDVIPLIATAEAWPKDNQSRTLKPMVALTVGITYAGLAALGLPQAALDTFPQEFREGITEPNRARILGDTGESAPEKWDVGGREPESLHAILIILAESETKRAEARQQHQTLFEAHNITVLHEINGDKLPASKEHFGFRDGISQPKLRGSARQSNQYDPEIELGEFLLGYVNEYGQLPDSPRLTTQDIGFNGSYMVFRKLYQDVAGFWNYIATNVPSEEDSQEALRALSDDDKRLWLAAKMVGRWPSGAPLIDALFKDDPSIKPENFNKFLYAKRDPHGESIPLGSHIRRSNPRDSLPPGPQESLTLSDRHLLIRRGLPYGKPLFPLTDTPPASLTDDGEDRGLIFLCLNANIKRQFEFVQQTWTNNAKFHGQYNDKDPILGDNNRKGDFTIPRDPVRRRLTHVPRFVTVKGGGYFFLPSLSVLRLLSAE